MNVMDLFRTKPTGNPPPAANQPGQPVIPGNLPAPGTETAATKTPGNGDTPASTEPKKSESPLDKFTEVVNTKPTDSGIPNVTFDSKPEDILKAAQSKDFTKLVTKEQLAAISEGGTKATEAMMEVINSVSQQTFADSAMVTGHIVQNALEKQNKNFQDALPGILRKAGINKTVASANPVFNHPAVKTMVSNLSESLAAKYPDASETEIAAQAKEYFTALAEQLVAGKETTETSNAGKGKANRGEIDWSTFLE